ncbi:DNA sulfur modification protein DndD [Vibrio sp. E14]|uniref:DNA sulfur modification protein DndD n=1 Tax=Vibrio sp. E14 TaxID=2849869 RepID=UPI001CF86996|nr:DNA sulfur modification protein DndD [Vibrio sp. E14]
MLITKLSLNNFRVFCGLHEIDLTPSEPIYHMSGETVPGSERPIILFGGLNGAGKTSILTAVRLALYGRQSFGKPLHNNEYVEELSQLIHKGNGINAPETAYIELEFTHNQAGSENLYKITRSWKRGKSDNLTLEQDGQLLTELSYDQCQGFLNELIPNGIADLFFFDGEKIAELAEDESGTVLNTAVKRLLGLDVIAKLKSDLNIYLKKHGASLLEQSIKQQLDSLDGKRIQHERSSEKLRYEANQVLIQIEHESQQIQKLEAELSSNGGAWAQTREQEQDKIDQLLKEKVELEKHIRMEMETSLPFALAPNAMKSLLVQIEKEKTVKQRQSFTKELDGFLDTLRKDLGFRLTDSSVAMEAVTDCFNDYIKHDDEQLLLDISERQANAIDYQINQSGIHSFQRFDKARHRLSEVEDQLDHISQNVARAPEKEQLQDTLEKIRAKDKKKQDLCNDYRVLLEEAKQELRVALETARQIQKLHDKHRDNANKNASIENAQNTILLMDTFAEQLTKARVKSLEQHFVESYKKLARKEDLQLTASINPKSFDVELIDEHGTKINRKAMSAGEKQIYAISILEALGKTSGRKLPIIIDTPLGRLDSHHRDKLVENYFPTASHQVVILSTDTEIDKDYINLIQDDIAKTYEICFDGKTKSSHLKQGYFWRNAVQEAV